MVIDSVAALTPKDEIEGDMGQSHVGKQARLMSQALLQTYCNRGSFKYSGYFHQPDPYANRCHVW